MFNDKQVFKEAFLNKLASIRGKTLQEASPMDIYLAFGKLIMDYISKNWVQTNLDYKEKEARQVYYFSMEFLLGRLMGQNLVNLGIREVCQEGFKDLGIKLEEVESLEPDAGLGNGGLGRLAACFMDSLASLKYPGHGCGIRFKYGHFEQKIINGYQVELPENWLREENVWEIRRADKAVEVRFGGNVRMEVVEGKMVFHHEDYESVLAVPYDVPIIGCDNKTVNTLRLWNAEIAVNDFDFPSFTHGDYLKVIEYKRSVEAISQLLYPDDSHHEGRVLRLKQEYFLVSAGLQSIIRTYKKKSRSLAYLHKKAAIHINDTHPALAIPELMRILIDEEGMGWNEAWSITTETISYTNHTILAEALEKWPVDIFKSLLPRIYMIVHEINERFCGQLWNKYTGDWQKIREMAIIADGYVKMAHLAIVGSYSVNGVAKIHTDILKKYELKNFYEFYPYKFNNKTNGITHRRWLLKANPALADLVTECIGTNSWIKEPERLIDFLKCKSDNSVLARLEEIKRQNKIKLAELIKQNTLVNVSCDAIFDVQIKRLHAYKRQLLNALHIMHLYNRLVENPDLDIEPRVFIFGAKAAPGYYYAKNIIKLINTIAFKINDDKRIKDKLKAVFLENYRVSLAEAIIPGSDVSEQISTASKEASGTGNMKFMMNGAVTIGTLDGANIEILDAVGSENIVTFGLTDREVLTFYHHGGYNSWEIYNSDERVKTILDQLVSDFLPAPQGEFTTIYKSLLHNNDEFFVLKDFAPYVDAQSRIDKLYKNKRKWNEMCLVNIAHSGKFSSDRTINEYAREIWNIKPFTIK
ncbi:MAG: glycogen/starch/alpha-glucan phosphorylase [Clostridia bacterium]|nr:glycogen/starch/alpha-glucan phosphorylase [Clostridia bacterium]